MSQTLLEKLQLKDEKSLLIQGLPSSIEKQFTKLAFTKNVTPLLKIKKIDFALVFAVNESQLKSIISEVLPALHKDGKLWVAHPKLTSKIATTLNRECSWNCICEAGFEIVKHVPLDHVWNAIRFKKADHTRAVSRSAEVSVSDTLVDVDYMNYVVHAPEDFTQELKRSKIASHFYDKLSSTNKSEYVSWISNAKRGETRSRRLEAAIDKLIAGKTSPVEI
ncbi:MAG: YdeI/OmpD-associated family protein [Bacteroidetes bacterium]|nr:YdeI/OmpD-associated family protein [Bacteroidota bacterium]